MPTTRRIMGLAPGAILPVEKGLWVFAIEKLIEARAAIEDMRSADNRMSYEQAWTRFVDALQLAFVRFHDEGKKTFSTFQPWVGRYEGERKKDPLLHYLYKARNQVQHGSTPLEWSESRAIIGAGFHGAIYGLKIFPDGTYEMNSRPAEPAGNEATITISPGNPILPTIFDRVHKETIEPPTEHLGSPLNDCSPIAVAELALSYYENILQAAITKYGDKRPSGNKP